jgi:hypothetical protein
VNDRTDNEIETRSAKGLAVEGSVTDLAAHGVAPTRSAELKGGEKARRISAKTGVMLSGARQQIDGLLGDHGLNRGLSLDEPAPTDFGVQHLDCVAVASVGFHQNA